MYIMWTSAFADALHTCDVVLPILELAERDLRVEETKKDGVVRALHKAGRRNTRIAKHTPKFPTGVHTRGPAGDMRDVVCWRTMDGQVRAFRRRVHTHTHTHTRTHTV